MGQVRDAVLTGGLVAFTVGVSTAQELRAKLRLDRIALLARAPVRVTREGRERRIDPAEVVLGDYILLLAGLMLLLYLPAGQRYFELRPLGPLQWLAIVLAVGLWFGAVRLQARYRLAGRHAGSG